MNRHGQASPALIPLQPVRPRGGAALGLVSFLMSISAVAHADVGTVTTLHSFSETPDGAYPLSALVPTGDGGYYGTTSAGGSGGHGGGTIFKISADGSESIVHSFLGVPSPQPGSIDGAFPVSGLTPGPGGNFYGTTAGNGKNGLGTFFQVTPWAEQLTLASFPSGAGGGPPSSPLVLGDDGNFYGASACNPSTAPGSGFYGSLYKISPTGVSSILYVFTGGADGAYPQALIKGNDGNFYGTTLLGGANNTGSVFRITPDGVLTTIYSFARFSASFPPDGNDPEALIQGSDGNLYGTTLMGGLANNGTLFQLTPGGVETILYNFYGNDAGAQPASLIQGSNGNFYGTTRWGGLSYAGTFFEVTPQGQQSTLYSFYGAPNGLEYPLVEIPLVLRYAALPPPLEISPGTFLDTGYIDGQYNEGSVYQLSVSAGDPMPEVRIAPSTATIGVGSATTLYWGSVDTFACQAGGAWSGAQPAFGSLPITPPAPGIYTYSLQCQTPPGGTVSASTTVTVVPPPLPVIDFPRGLYYIQQGTSEVLTVVQGDTQTLSWLATNADSCQASGTWSGPEPTEGSANVDISRLGQKTYTLSCTGVGGTTSVSLIVQVVARAPAITSFTIRPSTIRVGHSAQLQWTSTSARTCSIELNGAGKQVKVDGTTYVTPTASGDYYYGLVCSNGSLVTSQTAELRVE